MRSRAVAVLAMALLTVALAHPSGAQTPLAEVKPAQFRKLDWLLGDWLGSGGAYPAFFERYRTLNDSTIQMWSFRDSTFRVATDSSLIELRNGRISKSRGGRTQYQAILLEPDRIRFLPMGSTTGGFTFARRLTTEWTATLHPSAPGKPETIYTMRLLRR